MPSAEPSRLQGDVKNHQIMQLARLGQESDSGIGRGTLQQSARAAHPRRAQVRPANARAAVAAIARVMRALRLMVFFLSSESI
jgi:hypothetical protein